MRKRCFFQKKHTYISISFYLHIYPILLQVWKFQNIHWGFTHTHTHTHIYIYIYIYIYITTHFLSLSPSLTIYIYIYKINIFNVMEICDICIHEVLININHQADNEMK